MPRTLFGYNSDGSENPQDLEILEQAKTYLDAGASLRNVAAFVSSEASRSISHEGLKKRLKQPVRKNEDTLLGE